MKPADDSFDFPRLSEADPLLAEELSLLKARLPDASELASLASRLQLQGFDVASPPAAPAAKAAHWPNWLLGAGGAIAVGLGWWGLNQPRPVAPMSASVPAAATPIASPSPAPAVGVEAKPPASRAEHGLPTLPSPGESSSPPAAASAHTAAPPLPVDTAVLAPSRAPPTTTAPPSRDTAARVPTNDAPHVRTPGTSASLGAIPPDSGVPSELELLREARLALGASPTAALELTERHARIYPGGKLAQERELIAVSALVALGRRTAAMSRAAHFERAFPKSPYRKQLSELLR